MNGTTPTLSSVLLKLGVTPSIKAQSLQALLSVVEWSWQPCMALGLVGLACQGLCGCSQSGAVASKATVKAHARVLSEHGSHFCVPSHVVAKPW